MLQHVGGGNRCAWPQGVSARAAAPGDETHAECHDGHVTERKEARSRIRKDPEVRLEEIIDAAMGLFGERGYWGVSLQDVADACDFTVTGILYYVGSKEALLRVVLDGMDQRLFEGCADELGIDATGFELGHDIHGVDIADLFRVIVSVTSEDPRSMQIYSVVENESTDPGHPAHDYFITREKAALASYASAVPHGAGDPEAVARMAMGLLSGLHVQRLRDPHGIDTKSAWESIVKLIPVLSGAGGREVGAGPEDEPAGETSGPDSLPSVRE